MFGSLVPLRWPFEPGVLISVVALTGAYLGAITRWRGRFPDSAPVPRARVVSFLLAMGAVLLALQTPLVQLSDEYLFMMHGVRHMLLTLVMPLFLLLSLPGWMLRPLLVRGSAVLPLARVLANPFVAFTIFNTLFIVHHLPAVYDFTLAVPLAHAATHAIFMLTAIVTWWPVLSPLPELPPLSPLRQLIYLFVQALSFQSLGAAFGAIYLPLYQRYAEAPRVWGSITPVVDQQLGGLFLWIGGSMFFLGTFATVFIRWATTTDSRRGRYRALDRAR